MTIEDKLKETILAKHRSVLEFAKSIDMPYATITSIFKRGIQNSSITNIIKICKALGISADELADNRIVPASEKQCETHTTDIDAIIFQARNNIHDFNIALDGKPLEYSELKTLIDALEIAAGIIKRNRTRKE